MKSFETWSATRLLAVALILAIPGCDRSLTTEPAVEPVAQDAVLRIDAVSPVQLTGTVGEAVDPVPTVVVRNEKGKVVAGAKVVFIRVSRSDAATADSLTNRNVTTDSRGLATPGAWILGTTAGTFRLEARLVDPRYYRSDSGRVVTFNAQAKAAPAAVISVERFPRYTDGLPGGEMPTPVFRVIDRFGNGVGGVTVTFSVITGGGSLALSQAQSSPWGHVSAGTWTLGPRPGINSVVAGSQGLTSVTFSAQALDVGAVTWYDIAPKSVRYVERASIALCQDGTFELLTLDNGEAFPDIWPERELGKYTLTGTEIVLTFANGVTERGTLVGDDVSFVQQKLNREYYQPENWRFVKRSQVVPPGSLSISGGLSRLRQNIMVSHGGVPVKDAEVTVNGVRLAYCCSNLYIGDLREAVPAGGTLTLKVVAAGQTHEASGLAIEPPVITAPIAGSTFASTDQVRMAWTTSVDPERFEVCLNCEERSEAAAVYNEAGSAREFLIPPGALVDLGTGAVISVVAVTSNFLKSAAPTSATSNVVFVARSQDVVLIKK